MSNGRIAAVIGATRGIGRATVLRLARDGYRLLLAGRDQEAVDGTVEQVRNAAGKAWGRTIDVTDRSSVERWFDWAVQSIGAVEVCIVSAGVGHWGSLVAMTDDEWHETIRVNLDGAFYCTRAALSHMLPARKGHLVYVSSVMARRAVPNMAAYTASKAGLAALADSVALEVRPEGVKVTVVYPGTTATEMRDHQVGRPRTPDIVEEERQLAPEDIAEAIAWALEASLRSFPTGIYLEPRGNLWEGPETAGV